MRSFEMSLNGSINGSTIGLKGAGLCSQSTGQVKGDYMLSGGLPGSNPIPEFSHHAFSALVITGYPSESVSMDDVSNPFTSIGHHYERTVSVASRGALNLSVDIAFDGASNDIKSSFHVEGELLLPQLVSIDTVIETWVPVSEKEIEGTFVMPWVTPEGERIPGLARTKYYLDERATPALRSTAHRIIQIKSTGTDRSFHRDQSSFLFGDIRGAFAAS